MPKMDVPTWGGKPRKYLTRIEFARHCHALPGDVANAINNGKIETCRVRGKEKINVETETEKFVAYCKKAYVGDAPPGVPDAGEVVGIAEAERRYEVARAKLTELKVHEQTARLVDSQAVGRNYAAMGALLKKAVLGIADRLAPLLAGESDQHACWTILDTECRQILENLSTQIEKYNGTESNS